MTYITRTWKRDCSQNTMLLEAAAANLASRNTGRSAFDGMDAAEMREHFAARLLAGEREETRLAWFHIGKG